MRITKKVLSMVTAMACAAGLCAVQPVSAQSSTASASDFTYSGTLPTGGDKLTILSCNSSMYSTVKKWASEMGYSESQIDFINLNTGGGEAPGLYDKNYLNDNIDLFIVEPDWALKYLNDDTKTAPLSALGFTESDFAEQYSYTKEQGRDKNGVLKGVAWQASSGAWCYRADLAEKYLGVKTPEEMQAKVSDWDKFQKTAKEVYSASGGKTALTSTLSGIYTAFRDSRTQPWVVDNNLVIDDFCYDFISLAKNMTDNNYVTDVWQWTSDWYDLGETDSTMGYFVSSWGFGDAILLSAAGGKNGATYGNWKACQGPSPFNWGGQILCVSPDTDNGDMAASLINYIAVDKASMKSLAESDTEYLPNNMAVTEELISQGKNSNGLLGGQDQFEILHENAKALDYNGTITPYDSDVNMYFLDAVEDYCMGYTSGVSECIQAFKDKVADKLGIGMPVSNIKGDISGNGVIDLYDAIEICRYIMGLRNFTDEQMEIADYNSDSVVDLYDAIAIAKKLIEK